MKFINERKPISNMAPEIDINNNKNTCFFRIFEPVKVLYINL